MLAEPELERFDLSSLRVVITGGASAAIETIRAYQARAKGHLIELYGMLETGFHTYTRFTDDPQKVNGTIGRLVGDMEIRIIDSAGNDVPYGDIGEVAARTCLEAGARVTICARGEHALVQARDKSWAPLIFQDLFKKDQ